MDKTILIVDDVDINRELLAEIFKDEYDIIEAGNGAEALKVINSEKRVSAILLDLIMPELNGIGVLQDMNRSGMIKQVPVFLITAADSEDVLLEGYELGAIDVIRKPYMTQFLKGRVNNVVELYEHRNELERIVEKQIERFRKMNQTVVETLAALIEFRDLESGEHVKRICSLTNILMNEVCRTFPEYYLPKEEIDKIVASSILHDIGKISISDMILNKPGRLTKEEFEIMKQHTVKGCEILQQMPDLMDSGVFQYSYDICRHHHERWDGKGYPDGLAGDEITIWSQVVSVADVYDALTSERVYKAAFSSEKAVEMIMNGECGAFNPKVLQAFESCIDQIREASRKSHEKM